MLGAAVRLSEGGPGAMVRGALPAISKGRLGVLAATSLIITASVASTATASPLATRVGTHTIGAERSRGVAHAQVAFPVTARRPSRPGHGERWVGYVMLGLGRNGRGVEVSGRQCGSGPSGLMGRGHLPGRGCHLCSHVDGRRVSANQVR